MLPPDERQGVMRELAHTSAGAVFTCASLSMVPTIALGEKVVVHAVPLKDLRVGDVVVHERNREEYIVHRIALISPGRRWFLHVGDAANAAAPCRAPCSAIVGRVNRQRRYPSPLVYLKWARSKLATYWR